MNTTSESLEPSARSTGLARPVAARGGAAVRRAGFGDDARQLRDVHPDQRYHLELSVLTASGSEPVKPSSLGPDISAMPEASSCRRKVTDLVPISWSSSRAGSRTSGGCRALRPEAVSSRVALYRGAMSESEMRLEQSHAVCSTAR